MRLDAAVTLAALVCSSSACAALSSARAISLAASSGPRPHVEVAVVEDDASASTRRRLDVYEVLPDGLLPTARLDALSLIGAAGRGQVGSFRAYEAGDPSRVHSGLVARGPNAGDEPPSGAPVLLATRSGYASAETERLAGLDAAAAARWQIPLLSMAAPCGGKATVEVDAQASPSGRWICVARTVKRDPDAEHAGVDQASPRCTASQVEVVLFEDSGKRHAAHAFAWQAGSAGLAQCAVRDDGAALLLMPSAAEGRTASDARLLFPGGDMRPLTALGGAAVDAAPVGDRWAVLLHRIGEAGTTPWLVGGGKQGQRLLGTGQHALVPLPQSLVIVSVSLPDREALDVHRFDARGRRLAADRIDVE